MGLIKQGDSYALQLRNGKNQAGGLGLIGCFGGQIEEGETPEEALVREVAEESNLSQSIKDLEYIGEVRVESERQDQPITVRSQIYLIKISPKTRIHAREGELVTMTEKEVRANLDKITPATRACFEQLIKE